MWLAFPLTRGVEFPHVNTFISHISSSRASYAAGFVKSAAFDHYEVGDLWSPTSESVIRLKWNGDLAFKNPRRRTGAQTMTACHFGFSLWFQIIKPWSCCPAEAYCFLMTCCDTNINCSGCFYVKPRVEGMESGDCSQICLMCVWNERGRVNKREMKRGREGGREAIFWTC